MKIELNLTRNEVLRLLYYLRPELHDNIWLRDKDQKLVHKSVTKLVQQFDNKLGI